jgi:hydrogenase maturation protease
MTKLHGPLVLGLVNLLRSDDGLGVHATQRLRDDPRIDFSVTLLDGGTLGLGLMPHIAGYPRLLVIDALDEGKALVGLPGKASVHQLGFARLMMAMRLHARLHRLR